MSEKKWHVVSALKVTIQLSSSIHMQVLKWMLTEHNYIIIFKTCLLTANNTSQSLLPVKHLKHIHMCTYYINYVSWYSAKKY